MVILDTNVIIDHLRQSKSASTIFKDLLKQRPEEVFGISIVTVQELYTGRSTKKEDKKKYLLATISPLKILPYTYETAQLAGEISRDLDRPIQLADAEIAATAIVNNCQFLTLNKKDFAGIKQLALIA